jgi:hypothetical protein
MSSFLRSSVISVRCLSKIYRKYARLAEAVGRGSRVDEPDHEEWRERDEDKGTAGCVIC